MNADDVVGIDKGAESWGSGRRCTSATADADTSRDGNGGGGVGICVVLSIEDQPPVLNAGAG